MNEKDIFTSTPGASAVAPEVGPRQAPTSLPMLGSLDIEGTYDLITVRLTDVEAMSFDQAPMWPFTETTTDEALEKSDAMATLPVIGTPDPVAAEEAMLSMRGTYIDALTTLTVHDEAVAAMPDTRSTDPHAVHDFMNDTSERSAARQRDIAVRSRGQAAHVLDIAGGALKLMTLTAASQTNPFGAPSPFSQVQSSSTAATNSY